MRVEALAGDEVAARMAGADLRECERRDDGRDEPELHLRKREDGVRRRDRDVGCRDESGSSAERVTVHTRDDRRRTGVDRLEHLAHRIRVGDVRIERQSHRPAHPLDVGARTEARAFAGEDDCPGATNVDERLGELGDEPRVERVAPVRPRKRDAQDGAVALDTQVRHDARA